jgi:ribonuclease HI
MEAQKAEMVKIALEKLKEANIKKVKFYYDSSFSIRQTHLRMFVEAHRKSVHRRRMCQNGNHRRDHESLRHHAYSSQQEPLSAHNQLRSRRIFAQVQHE